MRTRNMVAQKTQKLKAANTKLKQISLLDGLTNIANRRGFDEALSREIRRLARKKLPMTLMLGDVDFFKKYNDAYGHPAGDRCLKKIASILKHCFKRSGDIVARYGGEEFAVILPEINLPTSIQQAQRLLAEVNQCNIPHKSSQCNEVLSLSLGLVNIVPQANDTQRLIELADKALYLAKQQGRNRYQIAEY